MLSKLRNLVKPKKYRLILECGPCNQIIYKRKSLNLDRTIFSWSLLNRYMEVHEHTSHKHFSAHEYYITIESHDAPTLILLSGVEENTDAYS